MSSNTAFSQVTKSNYIIQATTFINAFWNKGASTNAEKIWNLSHAFMNLDPKNCSGNELTPAQAVPFLETTTQANNSAEANELIKKWNFSGNGNLSLIEYLIGYFGWGSADDIVSANGEIKSGPSGAEEEVAGAGASSPVSSPSASPVSPSVSSPTSPPVLSPVVSSSPPVPSRVSSPNKLAAKHEENLEAEYEQVQEDEYSAVFAENQPTTSENACAEKHRHLHFFQNHKQNIWNHAGKITEKATAPLAKAMFWKHKK